MQELNCKGAPSFSLSQIERLTGTNFKSWKMDIELALGLQGYDVALREPEPIVTDESTGDQISKHENWHNKNRMALLLMKRTITETVRGSIPDTEYALEYLQSISEKYKESEKAESSVLMHSLVTMSFDGTGSIREYIMKQIDVATKLRNLQFEVGDQFLVHLVLNSLPAEYTQLKVTHNTQKDKWGLNELISICVQEESRLKAEKTGIVSKSVNLVSKPKWKPKKHQFKKNSGTASNKIAFAAATNAPTPPKALKSYQPKCFFCRKPGHFKKDCQGFKNWMTKRGKHNLTLNSAFYIELNLVNIQPHSFWIDSGSPLHIVNSLQGLTRTRVPRSDEDHLCVGNGMRVAVKTIGTLVLDLGLGNFLELNNVYCVPSMRRNLLSLSLLTKLGCSFFIDSYGIKVSRNSLQFGTGSFINDYVQLHCSLPEKEKKIMFLENNKNSENNAVNVNTITGVKRTKFNEKSAFLWHRRLGHISRERLSILEKQNILPKLDFSDFGDCVECIKGKITNTRKKNATRSSALLELIHTDICGPFKHKTICGNTYFITFIDDYSRYCYIYLLSEKSQAIETFKVFHKEVEKQLGRQIKVVRSDRGGEFYGRYTEAGQNKGPFALYLEKNGIKAQYTTPGTPEQNGVAERKNRTLLNMVRSMMCSAGLPRFLWGEALRTTNYLCNRSPSKAVSKTPFELWNNRQPSLFHCHVWGCKAEAKIYNPQIQKLDSKTISSYFIGYPEKSKGYRLYAPHHTTRIVETNQVRFIDEMHDTKSPEDFELVFEELNSENAATVEIAESSSQSQSFDHVLHLPVIQDEIMTEVVDHNVEPVALEVPEQQIIEPQPQQIIAPEPQPQPRRSQRIRKPTINEDDYVIYLQETDFDWGEDSDPTSYKEAIESDFASSWKNAMEAELKSMSDNNVWELVEPIANYKLIGCKWVYKTKRTADGSVERHKARLVAKGFTQKEGIDFTETFSPVSTKDSFRIIMAMVAHFDMELHQMDVKTAFLNGELEEEIYMAQPEGFIDPGKERLVCKLNKSIYGLKQASRQWYKKFDSVVTSFGFTENIVDECVYLKREGKSFIFLVLYVDDILLASSSLKLLTHTKFFLSKHFDMKDLGEATYVLGIEIKRDRTRKLLGLSQQSYINKILKRFEMQSCSSGEVPMSKGDKLTKNQCPVSDIEREDMKSRPYARLVGSLMYAQVCTRPDLAYAVGVLARFQSNPGYEHWVAGKKILRYLQRTKEYMLVYRRVDDFEVVGYTDSDFAGHFPDSNKSTSGYVFTLAGGAIAWKSMKQTLIATSTMQAEFIAIYEGVCEGLWIRNFLMQTKVIDSLVSRPLKIFCDNSAAVYFTKNNKRSTNSKHIDLKYYSVRQRVKYREIEVLKIDALSQLADPFTKALPVATFKKFVSDFGVLSALDV